MERKKAARLTWLRLKDAVLRAKISLKTKGRIIKATVIATLLYGRKKDVAAHQNFVDKVCRALENPRELTRRNQDHETARVESRQRTPENMTMRDKEKTRLRSKQRVPEDWMMRERETVDVQPQEEQSEKATSSTTTVVLREQQHQMPSHVQFFIPDRSRRIKIGPPKPPREKTRGHLQGGTGNQITGTFATRRRGRFGAREYRSDQQKSTRTDREMQ